MEEHAALELVAIGAGGGEAAGEGCDVGGGGGGWGRGWGCELDVRVVGFGCQDYAGGGGGDGIVGVGVALGGCIGGGGRFLFVSCVVCFFQAAKDDAVEVDGFVDDVDAVGEFLQLREVRV